MPIFVGFSVYTPPVFLSKKADKPIDVRSLYLPKQNGILNAKVSRRLASLTRFAAERGLSVGVDEEDPPGVNTAYDLADNILCNRNIS